MNFNNFTIKSQDAIQKAVEIAKLSGNQAIEPIHILRGIMMEGESLMQFLFQKVGVNHVNIDTIIQNEISSLPKVSGGEPYLSRESNEVMQRSI